MKLKEYFEQTEDTQSKLGQRLNPPVTQGAISQWLASRIPAERCMQIEIETGGAVTCQEMRPDVFMIDTPNVA